MVPRTIRTSGRFPGESQIEAVFEQVERLRHEREWDVNRREQADAVVEESRCEEHKAVLEAGQLDGPREIYIRLFRPAVLDELERPHRADAADLAHAVVAFKDLIQPFPDERLELLRLRERLLDPIDRFERSGAHDGIAAERPAQAPGSRTFHDRRLPPPAAKRQSASDGFC